MESFLTRICNPSLTHSLRDAANVLNQEKLELRFGIRMHQFQGKGARSADDRLGANDAASRGRDYPPGRTVGQDLGTRCSLDTARPGFRES
jgi:hypothetical protein